ncbi:MAG: hypothetical protein KDD82_29145 [Planctomycetes bacterium]|nr:hypothetical protein [Planctomycetota bacterium]
MDHDPADLLPPPPPSAWREWARSPRLLAWTACAGILVAVAVFAEVVLRGEASEGFFEILHDAEWTPLHLAVCLAFAVGVLVGSLACGRWLLAGRRLERRCPRDREVRFVRAPLGGVVSARFCVDGSRPVHATRGQVEVAFDAPRRALLSRQLLQAIARAAPGAHPEYASASRAASELAWAGVSELRIERDRLVILGGAEAPLVELVEHALELARAPSRLGLRAVTREHERGCPYCHQPLADLIEHPTLRCTGCDSVSHVECWKEHGGCAVFACSKSPAARRHEQALVDRGHDALERGDCPCCGQPQCVHEKAQEAPGPERVPSAEM